MLTLATIEACAMIHLKQTLTIAAFGGSRIGLLPSSAALNVQAQCQLVLNDHNVTGYSISMLPTNPATLTDGDYFRVTVHAQCAPNSLIGGWFYTEVLKWQDIERPQSPDDRAGTDHPCRSDAGTAACSSTATAARTTAATTSAASAASAGVVAWKSIAKPTPERLRTIVPPFTADAVDSRIIETDVLVI